MAVLRFIHRAKKVGFSLDEVRKILALRRGGSEPCPCVARMIDRNLAAIDHRIAELTQLRRQLRTLTKAPAGKGHAKTIRPIIEGDAK